MGRAWVMAVCTALGAWLAGCKASIPEGIYACDTEADCPSNFVCSKRGEDDRNYCYRSGEARAGAGEGGRGGRGGAGGSGAAGTDAGVNAGRGGAPGDGGMPMAGADAGPPAPVAPTVTGFSTLGGARSGGGLRLYDERFERGERRCTTDGRLCATGGFEP